MIVILLYNLFTQFFNKRLGNIVLNKLYCIVHTLCLRYYVKSVVFKNRVTPAIREHIY